MPANVKLGRLPAVRDDRVPFLSDLAAAATLPAPPDAVNFYAGIGDWGMLGNDQYGDCVEACVGHATLQFTTYADDPKVPTEVEALKLYTEVTGFNAADPSTDNGTVIMGPGSMMTYWSQRGATFGGQKSIAAAFAQVKLDDTALWLRQAIHYFGGVMVGINLPENVVAGDTVPYLWDDATGPIAGGHCIWVDGYETLADGLCFDLVSWGARYRVTLPFLRATLEEAVVIYDRDSLDKRGVNPDDFNPTELLAAMAAIKAA
jgi:hypothetical protein